MSVETGFWGIGVLFALLLLRVPVALSLIAVSFGGIVSLLGVKPALGILSSTPYDFVASWTMSAVPMFLLMGFVAFHAQLTSGLFDAAKAVLRRVPGALAISSVLACSGFAAVCGSSLATAASMGRIAIPEMVKAGYAPSLAAGAIAAGGTIGALIPPSILMILYGVFAETSITQVFLGGVTVGLLTALGYAVVVLILTALRPDLIPRRPIEDEPLPAREALRRVWPVLLLVLIVFGGLFSGFFTETEAGAETLAFLRSHIPDARSVPLCGNSIGTDRRFLARYLPEIEEFLHYRSVDVSTIKELVRRWYPGVLDAAPRKATTHRALDDIRESLTELRFYREQVFIKGG